MKWLILFFILGSCTTIVPNEQYGFWVDERPWRGTRLDNRNYIKPYRQCIDKETLNNINCK